MLVPRIQTGTIEVSRCLPRLLLSLLVGEGQGKYYVLKKDGVSGAHPGTIVSDESVAGLCGRYRAGEHPAGGWLHKA